MTILDSVYDKTRQIIERLNHSGLPLYLISQAALAIAGPGITVLTQLS
jgi:hypothetical protein